MAMGVILILVMLLGLVTVALLVGGLVLNNRHRREDEGRAADRINGP